MLSSVRRLPSAALMAVCFWGLTMPAALAFTDTSSHWNRTCIDQLAQRRLVSGYPDGGFRPAATVTRTEFAVLLLNAFPAADRILRAPNFRDVPTTYWGYRAIRAAGERAFFAGYPDGTFRPHQPIPRVQAIAIVANIRHYQAPESPAAINTLVRQYFDDGAAIPTYATRAIAAGALGRLAINYPAVRRLNPNQNATRGEVAAILCQALGLARTVPLQYVATGASSLFAIPPEAGGVGLFAEGLAIAQINGKYGYINSWGEVAIAPQYDEATSFSEDLAAVRQGSRWGYINRQGQMVIAPRFEQMPDAFHQGRALVVSDRETGFINPQGELVISLRRDDGRVLGASPFSGGLARIQLDGETGFINPAGDSVIALQPNSIEPFAEGLAAIRMDGKYGYIDPTGAVAIAPQFDQATAFAEGRAAVQINRRWGYIDRQGELVIAPQLFDAQPFAEGLAGVNHETHGWSYIDRHGAIAITGPFYSPDLTYRAIEPFSNGLALARVGQQAGFIDKTGAWAIEPQFTNATSFYQGLARVNVAGRWLSTVSGYDSSATPIVTYSHDGGVWGYIRAPDASGGPI